MKFFISVKDTCKCNRISGFSSRFGQSSRLFPVDLLTVPHIIHSSINGHKIV